MFARGCLGCSGSGFHFVLSLSCSGQGQGQGQGQVFPDNDLQQISHTELLHEYPIWLKKNLRHEMMEQGFS